MIVQNMTLDETYNALIKDIRYLESRAFIEMKKMKRLKKLRSSINVVHPTSKNNWRIKTYTEVLPDGRKDYCYTIYCKWITDKGWRAASVIKSSNTNDYLIRIFNSHFFIRYLERFVTPNFGDMNMKKVVDFYFSRTDKTLETNENSFNDVKEEDKNNIAINYLKDNYNNFLFSKDGIGLGTISTPKYQVWNTFYSEDMMPEMLLKMHQFYIDNDHI